MLRISAKEYYFRRFFPEIQKILLVFILMKKYYRSVRVAYPESEKNTIVSVWRDQDGHS